MKTNRTSPERLDYLPLDGGGLGGGGQQSSGSPLTPTLSRKGRGSLGKFSKTNFGVLLAASLAGPLPAQQLGFIDYISPEFANNDTSGQGQNYSEFLRSVENDFKNLDQVQLTINSQSVQKEGKISVARLNWNMRSRFRQSGEEWLLTNQKSALTYALSKDTQRWMLKRIAGDPIFGLSNQLGVLPVYRGKVDGVAITRQNSFGVREGDFGAGNDLLQGFGKLRLTAGSRIDLVIASAQFSCLPAGDGTDNLFISVTIQNQGRGTAQGSMTIEEKIAGLGRLSQNASLALEPEAQVIFTNAGQPIKTGIAPKSLCCADVKINANRGIAELNHDNGTLANVQIACP